MLCAGSICRLLAVQMVSTSSFQEPPHSHKTPQKKQWTCMPKGLLSQTSTAILEKPRSECHHGTSWTSKSWHAIVLESKTRSGGVFGPIVEGDHPARFDPFLKSSKFRGCVFFNKLDPLFVGFLHPRWLAGFQPSTVSVEFHPWKWEANPERYSLPGSLTARPWKMVVGRRSFPIGWNGNFSGASC